MDCSKSQMMMETYREADLGAEPWAQLMEHVQACPSCQQRKLELQRIEVLLQQHVSPDPVSSKSISNAVAYVEESLQHSDLEPEAQSNGNIYKIPLTMAAILLLAVGLWRLTNNDTGQGGSSQNDSIVIASAEDEFIVFGTDVDHQSMIAQEFDTFEFQKISVGDRVQKFQLEGVSEQTIQLRSPDKSVSEHVITEWNRKANARLQEEVQSYQELFTANAFQELHFARLEQLAYSGDEKVLNILESLAAVDSDVREHAERVLGVNKGLSILLANVKYAKTGSQQSRLQAIQTLGKIKSPIALSCLKELAFGQDEVIALKALAMLGRQKKEYSLPILEQLSEKGITDRVKKYAARQAQSMHKEISVEDQ